MSESAIVYVGQMARPLSEEKRDAILEAAARAIAEDGLTASTSKIARLAGVAEGSVFTYFATKDALFETLYRETKASIAAAMMEGYSPLADRRERVRRAWLNYMRWGVRRRDQRTAMTHLSVSPRITEAVRTAAAKPLGEIEGLLSASADPGLPSPAFASAIMTALAETTIGFMLSDHRKADQYAEAGFEAYWRAISGSDDR